MSITCRKSHTYFWSVPKATTFDDLERPLRTHLRKIIAALGTHQLSAATMYPRLQGTSTAVYLLYYMVYANRYSRVFSRKGGHQTTVGWSKMAMLTTAHEVRDFERPWATLLVLNFVGKPDLFSYKMCQRNASYLPVTVWRLIIAWKQQLLVAAQNKDS